MYRSSLWLRKAAVSLTLLLLTLLSSPPLLAQCPMTVQEAERDPNSGQISGYVFDPGGEYKIGGATVYAFFDGPEAGILQCVLADDSGWFLLRNIAPGDYRVVAYKPEDGYPDPANGLYGYEWWTLPKIKVVQGQRNTGVLTHVFPKAGKLELLIADAETKRPLKSASYRLYREDDPNGGIGGSTTLDEGKLILLLPPVPCGLEVSQNQYKAEVHYKKWFYGNDGSKEHARGLVIPAGATRHIDVFLTRAEDRESSK